jgi:aminoglycoside 3-N-acetyltransferase
MTQHTFDLSGILHRAPDGPILVHSDAFKTSNLIPRSRDRQEQLSSHLTNVFLIANGREVQMPTFNYEYCRSGEFDIDADTSQVGPISEAFRTDLRTARTPMPIFSIASERSAQWIPQELAGGDLDPFDDNSAFGALCAVDGTIVWYGAVLESTTLIHHAERHFGGVPYRYDKFFNGTMRRGGECVETRVRYHVWPLGSQLQYDWEQIESELRSLGVLRRVEQTPAIAWAPARALREYFTSKLESDPLSLLTTLSQGWVTQQLVGTSGSLTLEQFE